MSSAIYFSLDQSKILSSGNGLTYVRDSLYQERHWLVLWNYKIYFAQNPTEQVGFFKKEARRGQRHYFQILYTLQVLVDLYIHVNEQEAFCIEQNDHK